MRSGMENLVGLDTFVQQHLTDLRDGPLLLISDSPKPPPVQDWRTKPLSRHVRWLDSGATITPVRKQPAGFRRRKLSTVVRKAITSSYYAEQGQMEIARAAKQQNVSMSSISQTCVIVLCSSSAIR